MAQVIELFGAPGSGKSTLVRALDGQRVGGRRLVAAPRLLRVLRRGVRSPRRPSVALDAGPLLRLADRVLRRDLTPVERRAILRHCPEHLAPLVARLADAPRTPGPGGVGDPIAALERPGFVSAALLLRILADRADDAVVVVLDEGPIQRLNHLHDAAADEEALRATVALLPASLLTVHVHAAPDAVAARLASRGRVIDRHQGVGAEGRAESSADDARLYARVAGLLRERDVTATIDVDTGGLSPEASASRVIAALAVPSDA